MIQNLSLQEQTIIQALGFEIALTPKKLTTLALPSGKLVICDPLSMPETEPYTLDFPKGEFPVYSLMANLRDEQGLAFLVVEFTEEAVKDWEILVVPGEEIDWRPDYRAGFVIDTSYLALMDESSADFLIRDLLKDEEEVEKTFMNGLRKLRLRGGPVFLKHEILPQREIFVSWVNPGAYSAYVGFSSEGRISRLMIDFSLVDSTISKRGISLLT